MPITKMIGLLLLMEDYLLAFFLMLITKMIALPTDGRLSPGFLSDANDWSPSTDGRLSSNNDENRQPSVTNTPYRSESLTNESTAQTNYTSNGFESSRNNNNSSSNGSEYPSTSHQTGSAQFASHTPATPLQTESFQSSQDLWSRLNELYPPNEHDKSLCIVEHSELNGIWLIVDSKDASNLKRAIEAKPWIFPPSQMHDFYRQKEKSQLYKYSCFS
jgi:hypothetical protein